METQNKYRIFVFIHWLLLSNVQSQLANISPSGALDLLQSTFPDQWRPKGVPDKNDLRCTSETKTSCFKRTSMNADNCCNCEATPIWEGKEQQLPIEYLTVLGKAMVLHENPVNLTTVYKIEHSYAEISQMPLNFCNNDAKALHQLSTSAQELANISTFWPRIVKIDLSSNKISDIGNLNCLTALDTLDLSSNRIRHLSNTSFVNLSHLRILLLDHNRIKTMDTFIIAADTMHLSRIDLSENELKSLDITNFITKNPFCSIDYSGNVIEKLTNIENKHLNTSTHYESGFVSLQGNMFNTFPDFKELLNLDSIAQLGSLLELAFDFRDTEIGCDCALEPIMEKSKNFVKTYWRDYFDVKCASPESLKGKSVVNVTLDDFVCDLEPKDGCPFGCDCKDIPSQQTLFVNCAHTGKTEFPDLLPLSKYSAKINLNLTGNEITNIGNISYLNKISNLDMSQNKLEEIDEEAAKALENSSINLSGNSRLTSIPHSMQYLNICSLHMSSLVLDCTCNSKWIENWMNVKSCSRRDIGNFLCRVENHGIIPAEEFSLDMLDCNPKDRFLIIITMVIAGILLTLIIVATLLFQFRYEVLIMLLKLRQKNLNAVKPQHKYDAFISFDSENDELRKWVYMTLVQYLEENGYKIFLTCRDLPFGEVQATATIDTLQLTRNFVLILSESYLNQTEQIGTDNEWKYGWHMFTTDSQKNIVLINYDHVSSFDVEHPQIKAFLRVGGQVNFLNSHRNIMNQISNKLGPKCTIKGQSHRKDNSKRMFVPAHLFQAREVDNREDIDDADSIYDISDDGEDKGGDPFETNGNNCANIITDMNLNTQERNNSRNITVNKVHGNSSPTISKGILDIKEIKRPVNGPLKHWR